MFCSILSKVTNSIFNFQEASSVLETIYTDYADSEQKAFLVQEFYAADFAFFKVCK